VALVLKRTLLTERKQFVVEVSDNFLRIEEFRVVSETDPYGHILDFLGRSHYFFFQIAPQWLSAEAEWTPFQTHYFLENLSD
jgi:hypothetical protein